MAGIVFSEASGVNDSMFGKSQDPIKMFVEERVEAFQKFSMIPDIFMEDDTSNYGERYTSATALANFEPVGEGGAYPRNSIREGYSKLIEPDEWKNSFEITQKMVEDQKIGKAITQGAGIFTTAYNRGREQFASSFLNNGQSTTMTFGANQKSFNITCNDGLALFNTAHTSITGGTGTQSNYFGNPFSYDALCLVEEAMQYFTDDDGNILNIMPDTIVIPSKSRIKKLVFDAVGAEGIPGTANNSFSYQFGRWTVIESPYLTNSSGITAGTDTWYVMDSNFNKDYGGLIWLERIPLSVKSYIDENTDNNVWKGRSRYGAGPNNWRAIAKVNPGLGTVLS
jgi:hypothetical protein